MSIPVHTADGPYAAAIAELPLSSHRAADQSGAVVVLTGRAGWAGRLEEAVAHGARGIVVCDPDAGEPDELTIALAADPGIPVIVDRPLLRSDLVDDVRRGSTRAPALVQVECSGSDAEFAAVARDALGWARVLAGGALDLLSSRSTAHGFGALLTRAGDDLAPSIPVTVVATRRPGTGPWIRAIALGAERIEVTIDVARRSAVVERTSEAGRVIHPTRWETPERVVLRRAFDALDDPAGYPELAAWQLDAGLAVRAAAIDSIR